MKLLVLKYSLDATQAYDSSYKVAMDLVQQRWLEEPRRNWIHRNQVKLTAVRADNASSYKMHHGLSIELDGPLLTEYLLRFGEEPCEYL